MHVRTLTIVALTATSACHRPAPSESTKPPPAPAEHEEPCVAPEPIDVLFVGNSYMIMHDLPALVEALGTHAGVTLRAEMLAEGGKNFEYHATQQETSRILEEGEFDVVVLQSHSLDPLRNHEGFLRAGKTLVEMVRTSGAEPILFQTWARKAGHSFYRHHKNSGGDPDAMQRSVSDSYAELSERTGADVIEVGRAWRRVRKRAPTLDLYASDKAHPGEVGAYLTAAVLFAALTDISPVGNVEPLLGVDPEAAKTLQTHAAAVVKPRCDEIRTDG